MKNLFKKYSEHTGKGLLIGLAGIALSAAMVFLPSCERKSINPTYSKAKFNITFNSGSSKVVWDSIFYTNQAGNKFGVKTANFYISNVTLKNGSKTYNSKKIFYIDPKSSSKSSFSLDSIPPGDYTDMSFYIGLGSAYNSTIALAPTGDHANMLWPTTIGGGYHFLKLDGNYKDSLNVVRPYSVRIGKTANVVTVNITKSMHQIYWNHVYTLAFDVNEVFMNPAKYDFNWEVDSTMYNDAAILKIKNNMPDVFSLTQDN